MPKIVKSSSLTEKPKLGTVHSPTMRSPTAASSFKVPFWESPDLSPGIESILITVD